MLTIEFEEPTRTTCACCGKSTTRLTRFVYRDGDAHAVYYAQFTPDHPQKRLSGLIGLGPWGGDASPEQRVAFPLEIWATDDNFQVGLVDASASPWSHVTFMGRILNRSEALGHELLQEAFHVTDRMVTDDAVITGYFNARGA
ncbi:MAG: hypothetical protein RLO46_14310 [Pseudomonadales bacterium]